MPPLSTVVSNPIFFFASFAGAALDATLAVSLDEPAFTLSVQSSAVLFISALRTVQQFVKHRLKLRRRVHQKDPNFLAVSHASILAVGGSGDVRPQNVQIDFARR